ncbi:MAG TPA: iron-sulfur cluster assembly protein [Ktedonobacterales bacterium]|jgi:FeS assembly SUF system protein
MAEVTEPNNTAVEIEDSTITADAVFEKLRECYDPEIPVNIVDLGLVYALKIIGGTVDVVMTLTAIGCPVAGDVMAEVEERVREVEGVEQCNVTLTFDPAWTPERMTEDARWELGMS